MESGWLVSTPGMDGLIVPIPGNVTKILYLHKCNIAKANVLLFGGSFKGLHLAIGFDGNSPISLRQIA